jgi:hypothetical protein
MKGSTVRNDPSSLKLVSENSTEVWGAAGPRGGCRRYQGSGLLGDELPQSTREGTVVESASPQGPALSSYGGLGFAYRGIRYIAQSLHRAKEIALAEIDPVLAE